MCCSRGSGKRTQRVKPNPISTPHFTEIPKSDYSLSMGPFFIKFNVLYLGSLFFALLFLGALSHSARPSFGDSFFWTTKYLDGMVISTVYLSLLLLAVLSWCFSLWKTWKLTTANSAINRTRLLAFGWLLGTPVFIFSLQFIGYQQ